MNRCEGCGRPGPGGLCPDCMADAHTVSDAKWTIDNDDTLSDGIPPIPTGPVSPSSAVSSPPQAGPPPPATQEPGPFLPPASARLGSISSAVPLYRSDLPKPHPAKSEAASEDLGFSDLSQVPPPGFVPGAAPPEEPKKPKQGVAGMVVLAVFACIVLAGGAYFVYRMLGQDDSLATQIASPASSPTPSVPSVTPTQSTMAPVPEPTATATTTATATATATTITTVTATATATVTTVAEPSSAASATRSAGETKTAKPASTSKPTNAAQPQKFERFYPLAQGDKGYVVEALQRILDWRGIATHVDGDFGNATERSVRQWQAQEGLSVTGTVDDTTWDSLLPKLKKGSKDGSVIAMQQLLRERGYVLEVDGVFGKETDSVVREFQRDRGLEIDGIVGPNTWAALLA